MPSTARVRVQRCTTSQRLTLVVALLAGGCAADRSDVGAGVGDEVRRPPESTATTSAAGGGGDVDARITALKDRLQALPMADKAGVVVELGDAYLEKARSATTAERLRSLYRKQAITNYRLVLESAHWPGHAPRDELLWKLATAEHEEGLSSAARQSCTTLVRMFSDSAYVPEANLLLGDLLCAAAETREARTAWDLAARSGKVGVAGPARARSIDTCHVVAVP